MKELTVKTIDKDSIVNYTDALNKYFSDMIDKATGKSILDSNTLKNKIEEYLSIIGNGNKTLFTAPIVKPGDRFRAEEYNSKMTDLYIDLLMFYNKILLIERTINKIIDTQISLRYIITNKIEEAFVNYDILHYILENNILFDKIHIISNKINKHVDLNTNAEIENNSVKLKVLDQTEIPDKYLMNDIYVIPFNSNINQHIIYNNIDKYNILNIYAVTSSDQTFINKDIADRFGLNNDVISKGITFGIVISLNQPTKINKILLNSLSKYPIEIIGIYYTLESFKQNNAIPIHIEHNINKYNIDDINIYLKDTIEAKDIILIINQKYYEHKPIPDRIINYDDKIRDILDESYTYELKNRNKLSYRLTNKIESIIKKSTELIYESGKVKPLQYIYNIIINSINIAFERYDDASTYSTDNIIEDKNIHYISIITNNDVTNDSNIIQYYLNINNTKYPIIPQNMETYKQVIEITNNNITEYKLDLLADVDSIAVYRNGAEYTDYIINSIYNNIGYELKITGNIQKNDIFVIKYRPTDKDGNGRHINYKRLDISSIYKPNLKNKQCINNKSSNLILVKYKDGIKSHKLGDTIHKVSTRIDNEDIAAWYIDHPIGDLPDNAITYESGAIITQDYVILPQNTIYYGIFDETITLQNDLSNDTIFTTQYDYVPGSLFVWWKEKDILLNIEEYDVDNENNINNHNEFTLKITGFTIPKDNTLLIQYTPIHFTNGVSNIKLYDVTESFTKTSNKQIELTNIPYIDRDIIIRANKQYNDWIEANGVYIYKYNQSIIYKPIDIIIDGISAINRTKYINNEKGKLNTFIKQINNYEYIIDGYNIIFNTDIIDKNIKISYYINSNKYNIEAKLYRTDRTKDITTPILNPFGVITKYVE